MPDHVSLREKVTHLIDDIERVTPHAVDAAGRIGLLALSCSGTEKLVRILQGTNPDVAR